ncbi:MAG: hypothetical protein GY870_03780 [archaeon]|nr:hypothetical protein [archaeon]
MSDEEELQRLRQKKLAELQEQAIAQQQQEQIRQQQDNIFEQQKNAVLRLILSSDARVRLENLKMVKQEIADSIALQLIQLYQQGSIQRNWKVPLSDQDFKSILAQIQKQGKRNTKIKIM